MSGVNGVVGLSHAHQVTSEIHLCSFMSLCDKSGDNRRKLQSLWLDFSEWLICGRTLITAQYFFCDSLAFYCII